MIVRFYHLGEFNTVPEFLSWARVLDWMVFPNASLCDSVAISSHLTLFLEIPVDVRTVI